MKIVSENLKEELELMFDKNIEDITDNELNEVKDISFNRLNIMGEITKVDINDLLIFPSLETISLLNMELENGTFIYLAKLSNLKHISFINCEVIDDIDNIYLCKNISNILISNCQKFNYNILGNMQLKDIMIDKEKDFDLNYLINNKLNSLYITNTSIENIDVFNNLYVNELTISNDLYNENKELFDKLVYKVIVLATNGIYPELETGNYEGL